MALAAATPDSLHFVPITHVPVNIDPHLSPNNSHVRLPVSPADGGLGWMLDMEAEPSSQPFNFHQIQQQHVQPTQQQQQQQLKQLQHPNPMGMILHQLDDSHLSKHAYLQQQHHFTHCPNPSSLQQYRSSYQSPAAVQSFNNNSPPIAQFAADFRDMHHVTSSCPTIFPKNSQSPIPIPIHTNTFTIKHATTTTPPATAHSNSASPEYPDDDNCDDDQVCSPSSSPVDHESIFARYLTVMSETKTGNNNNNNNNNATTAPPALHSFATTTTTTTTTTNNNHPSFTTTHTSTATLKSKPYLRRPIQKDQKHVLKRMFKQDPSPLPAQVRWIAAELGLEKNKVKVWFQNQRAQLKRRQSVIALRPNNNKSA
ncbi:hypothetical protein BJ741DRAFT_607206 [Chytriomyces cf. hyalinus JEL632]|nr:hypothetical protein BJ741DRAFT_607206 [Chytriomyces cf. hyalinus JEL632]